RQEIVNEGFSWSDIDKRYIDLYLGNCDVMLSYSEYKEMIKAIEQLGLTDVDVSDLFSIYIKYEYADSWEEAVQWFIEEMSSVDNDDYCDPLEAFLDMRASERGDNY
ncbi:MAG: hypothetical protein IJ988_02210, partial [Firmicutes bacterium]|nr:hypothetical protein [Bacillota bacterium]